MLFCTKLRSLSQQLSKIFPCHYVTPSNFVSVFTFVNTQYFIQPLCGIRFLNGLLWLTTLNVLWGARKEGPGPELFFEIKLYYKRRHSGAENRGNHKAYYFLHRCTATYPAISNGKTLKRERTCRWVQV